MKSRMDSVAGRIRTSLVVAAVAAASAASVNAVTIPFSQTVGWFQGPPTALLNNYPGGLDFFGPVTAPPGAPNTFSTIAWGCIVTNPATYPAANCANAAVQGFGTTLTDPFLPASPPTWGQDGRSALRVFGNSGILTDAGWTDVTAVLHQNHPILGNFLDTAQARSFLRLNDAIADVGGGPSLTSVDFVETNNDGTCTDLPAGTAPINPLGTNCDDYAFVSGLDLTSIFLPPFVPFNPTGQPLYIDFQLNAASNSGALVCGGPLLGQPAACGSYSGFDDLNDPSILIYTGENPGPPNQFTIQAKLRPINVGPPVPLFVIGDVEPHAVGNTVNFWGAQWWKNNDMSGFVSNGVASFKGYASNAQTFCGGQWQSRPGNSSKPPQSIPDEVAIIVTDTVLKDGPNISGTIKQILLVKHDGKYGPNPGHRGGGPVTQILCTAP